MQAYSQLGEDDGWTPARPRAQPLHPWRDSFAWGVISTRGAYGEAMEPSLEVRRANFSRFIQRALSRAAEPPRRWSVPKIAKAAGIGNNTIYRWKEGTWKKDGPRPEQIVAFCDVLDIPPQLAFDILWPGKSDRAQATEPWPLDSDMETVLRKLEDPNVPEQEKYLIRETLRSLAARLTPPARKGRQTL